MSENNCDNCECPDPWRYNEKKLTSDVEDLVTLMKTKVSMQVFIFVFMLWSAIISSIVWASYDTQKTVLITVLEVRDDVIRIKSKQENVGITNRFIPVNVYEKKSKNESD